MTGSVQAPSGLPEPLWQSILDDLADRLAGIDQLEVVSVEAVTWNDGSLGCPKPGMMYTQALVDGYHVIVSVDGEEFDYRTAESGPVVLCENAGG